MDRPPETEKPENRISGIILDAAIAVHLRACERITLKQVGNWTRTA